MAQTLTFVIEADPPARLDKALARDVPASASLSRSRLGRLISDGAVSVGGAVVQDVRARVAEGDMIAVAIPAPEVSDMAGEDIPLDIVFEDADIIVVNKPAGMVVHPAPGTPSGTLVNALIAHCGDDLSGVGGVQRPGIVHRIDKDTSGLLVVAKSDAAHHGLAAQFAAHTAHRQYLAVCHGVPDKGDPRLRGIKGASFETGAILKIQTHLARHRTDRQRQAVCFEGGRHAVTRLQVDQPLGQPAVAAVVRCWLETGRTHQIRVHLAHCGHGLIGDPVYGGARKLSAAAVGQAGVDAARNFGRQALHAATLGFVHPTAAQELSFEACVPADMVGLIRSLGGRSGTDISM